MLDTITDLSIDVKIDLSAITTNLNLIISGVMDIDANGVISNNTDTTTSGFDVFFVKLNNRYYLAYETIPGEDNVQGDLGVIDIGVTQVGSLSTYTVSNGVIIIN
jgi:hypothetical protein